MNLFWGWATQTEERATDKYHHIELSRFAPAWAHELAGGINTINHRLEKIMATLDDLVAAAADEDTKIDSLIALVVALKAKVDAIPGLTAEQQAKIDAAFASITDNPARIQEAIDANTPPA